MNYLPIKMFILTKIKLNKRLHKACNLSQNIFHYLVLQCNKTDLFKKDIYLLPVQMHISDAFFLVSVSFVPCPLCQQYVNNL